MTGWAMFGLHGLGTAELGQLLLHFMLLSMLAVGGAITTAPDMQRTLVHEHGWISDLQFTNSVALAQAAPGPNILFVALLGWNSAGLAGVAATMTGILLPSSLLAVAAGRHSRQRAAAVALRAFTAGLTPLTLGLLLATGWVLTAPTRGQWSALALVLVTIVVMLRSRISPLWLIGLGAVMGVLGWA